MPARKVPFGGELVKATGDASIDADLIPASITRDTELAAHAADADAHHVPTPYVPPVDAVYTTTFTAAVGTGQDQDNTGRFTAFTDTFSIGATSYRVNQIYQDTADRDLWITFDRELPSDYHAEINGYKFPLTFVQTVSGVGARYFQSAPPGTIRVGSNTLIIYEPLTDENFLPGGGTPGQIVTPTASGGREWTEQPTVFDAQAWETSTNNLLSDGFSTLPYQDHSNRPSTVQVWANSETVPAQTNAFNVAVRIPIADKGVLEHYRLTSSRDSTVHAIVPGQHVEDVGNYAYYNVQFPSGAATTIAVEEREEHDFNPRKGRILFPQLGDTPANYTGAAGRLVKVNAAGTALEFGADTENADLADVRTGQGLRRTPTSGVSGDGTVTIALQAENGSGQTALGNPVVQMTNQVFATAGASVTPPSAWNIPTSGEFEVTVTEANNPPWHGQFFAEELRNVPAASHPTTTTDTGNNYLPIELGNGQYLRILRGLDNVASYALSDTGTVSITIRPVIVQGLIEVSGDDVTDATYDTLGADVNLIADDTGGTWGAWTDVYRYTAVADDEHWDFHAALEGSVNWGINNGDRGELAIRMTKKNSAGATQETLVPNHLDYIRNQRAVNQTVGPSISTTVDLDTGDYFLIEGRALRQLGTPFNTGTPPQPAAGAAAVVISNANSVIARAPREVGGAPATGQQQIPQTPERAFYRFLWQYASVSTAPTGSVGYDGVLLTNLHGWRSGNPTGSPPSGQALYWNRVLIIPAPGTGPGWRTENAVYPASNVRFANTQFPTSPTQITSTPPTTGLVFANYYIPGSGWSPTWIQQGYPADWTYLDRAIWYPDSATSTADIDFPVFDTAQYRAFALVAHAYTTQGHDITDVINFTFEPFPNIITAARATNPTIQHSDGGSCYWQRFGDKYEIMSDLHLPTGADRNDYGLIGFNFQFQKRSTVTSTTSTDRVHLMRPQVYDDSGFRYIRWDIELWVR